MVDVHQFPALRHLFGAYLNRDWPDEYGTVDHALESYRKETDATRRHAAIAEVDAILSKPGSDDAVAKLIDALGCEYDFEPGGDAAIPFLRNLEARIAD